MTKELIKCSAKSINCQQQNRRKLTKSITQIQQQQMDFLVVSQKIEIPSTLLAQEGE